MDVPEFLRRGQAAQAAVDAALAGVASAPRAPIAGIAPPIELTPGAYLQVRRIAAGMSLNEAATCYAHHALGTAATELLLSEVERDVTVLGEPSLRRLQACFAFDPGIYLALAEGLPIPSLCASCACSWRDPCVDRGHPGPCAWADAARARCTACAAIKGATA